MCICTHLPSSTCSRAPPGASAPTEEAGPGLCPFGETASVIVPHVISEGQEEARITLNTEKVVLVFFMASGVSFLHVV